MKALRVLALPIVALLVLLLATGAYTVHQVETVIIVRLGNPVRVVSDPGLHFKLPLLEDAIPFEKWVLDYDSSPREVLTRDKKNLVVDNYAKWRIVDPLRLYQAVKSVEGAQARLDDIIYSELRQSLGNFTLSEIVKDKRTEIMAEVTKRSNDQTQKLGIEIIDVRIKRADLPKENEGSVFQRMQTERIRDAKLYRSEGEESARKIRAEADKQKQIILAEANRDAQETRGRADGEAIRIFAAAYGKDEDFFRFFRSMDAYRKSFATGTTLVLTPDMEMLQFFKAAGLPPATSAADPAAAAPKPLTSEAAQPAKQPAPAEQSPTSPPPPR